MTARALVDADSRRSVSPCAWVVWPLMFAEVYCMFPFENKGDFAEIGMFLVNGVGSISYGLRVLVVGWGLSTAQRRGGLTPRWKAVLLATLLSPVLVWTMQSIAHPSVGTARTVAAYAAGPQLLGALLGGFGP